MSNRTRYFVNPYGEILTIQYSVTEAHPDYVPQIKDARDVTDNVTEIDGMLECPTNDKHGVVVRAPVPEPTQWEAGPQDLVGNIARGKAIIEAQAEAIYLNNPEYIPCELPNLSDEKKDSLRNGVWRKDDDGGHTVDALVDGDMEATGEANPWTHEERYQAIDRAKRDGGPAGFARGKDDCEGEINKVHYLGTCDVLKGPDMFTVMAQGHKVEDSAAEVEDEHAGMVQNPMTGEWGWGFF